MVSLISLISNISLLILVPLTSFVCHHPKGPIIFDIPYIFDIPDILDIPGTLNIPDILYLTLMFCFFDILSIPDTQKICEMQNKLKYESSW